MTEPSPFPDQPGGEPDPGPVPGGQAPPAAAGGQHGAPRTGTGWRPAVIATFAVIAGTAALGAVGGLVWAAVAPRAALVMVGPGAAGVVHAETSAFIAADGWFSVVMLAGGVISGLLGYLLAVRRHGPLAMAGILAGALAAAFLARWVGEQPGRARFEHLLATLPVGAHFSDALTLGSAGALAFWPFAAAAVAGLIQLFAGGGRPRRAAGPGPAVAPGDPGSPWLPGPGAAGAPPGDPGRA